MKGREREVVDGGFTPISRTGILYWRRDTQGVRGLRRDEKRMVGGSGGQQYVSLEQSRFWGDKGRQFAGKGWTRCATKIVLVTHMYALRFDQLKHDSGFQTKIGKQPRGNQQREFQDCGTRGLERGGILSNRDHIVMGV